MMLVRDLPVMVVYDWPAIRVVRITVYRSKTIGSVTCREKARLNICQPRGKPWET